jgi:SAM-dependent methyltransferase
MRFMPLSRVKSFIASQVSLQRARRQPGRPCFVCPICNYTGVFIDWRTDTVKRTHAECPRCHGLERHRLQWLVVVDKLQKEIQFSKLRVLHIAPDKCLESRLRPLCASYLTADISGKGVDRQEDLTKLSFSDSSFDLVYASHVLEHISDDESAIKEIRRVLSPGGRAVLPVPILSDTTVEYGDPNPYEGHHVRAPGLDYFKRYERVFDRVHAWRSTDFDTSFQLYTLEDRSNWPAERMPKRPKTHGLRHLDYVPVCEVASL